MNGTAGAVNRVGTESPAGDGRFGQADLAGDVWSWNLDWSANYTNPCNDCADLTPASDRVIRGGSFDDVAVRERAANRDHSPPTNRTSDIGIRCARTRNRLAPSLLIVPTSGCRAGAIQPCSRGLCMQMRNVSERYNRC